MWVRSLTSSRPGRAQCSLVRDVLGRGPHAPRGISHKYISHSPSLRKVVNGSGDASLKTRASPEGGPCNGGVEFALFTFFYFSIYGKNYLNTRFGSSENGGHTGRQILVFVQIDVLDLIRRKSRSLDEGINSLSLSLCLRVARGGWESADNFVTSFDPRLHSLTPQVEVNAFGC
jgi:hypothetical protein